LSSDSFLPTLSSKATFDQGHQCISFYEVTIHTLPFFKCIRSVSVRSSLPCINIGVLIELTFNLFGRSWETNDIVFSL